MSETLEQSSKPLQILREGDSTPLPFRSNHDIAWDALGPQDAQFVRNALSHAEKLRREHADPGDVYLEFVLQDYFS